MIYLHNIALQFYFFLFFWDNYYLFVHIYIDSIKNLLKRL